MKNKTITYSLLLVLIILPGYRFMVSGYIDLFFLAASFLFIIWAAIGPHDLNGPRFFFAYLFFWGSIIISVINTTWMPGSLIDFQLLIVYIFIFILVFNIPWDHRPAVLSGLMVTGLAYTIIIVLPNTIWQPNNTAAFINIMITISLALIIRSRQIVLAGLCLGSSLAVLWFTGSRGGMVAGMVGISVVLLVSWREDPDIFKQPRLVAAADLIGSVLFVYTGSISRIKSVSDTVASSVVSSLNHRLYVWFRSLDIFAANPWLGSGPNTFAHVMQGYPRWIHAHSLLIQILVERGIIGLIAAAILLTIIVGSLLFYCGDPLYKAVGLGLVAIVFVHGLVDLPWYEPFVMMPIIILGGLALDPREPTCHNDK